MTTIMTAIRALTCTQPATHFFELFCYLAFGFPYSLSVFVTGTAQHLNTRLVCEFRHPFATGIYSRILAFRAPSIWVWAHKVCVESQPECLATVNPLYAGRPALYPVGRGSRSGSYCRQPSIRTPYVRPAHRPGTARRSRVFLAF